MNNFDKTILNAEWLRKNEARVKENYPSRWRNIELFDGMKFGRAIKLLGVLWDSPYDLCAMLTYFEKIKIVERKLGYIQANPESIFTEVKSGHVTILRN